MKTFVAVIALLGALVVGNAHAQDVAFGKLTVIHPWARATVTPTGGAYLAIDNAGPDDRLLKVETPIATAELHQHIMQGNVMQMRPVDGIALPPGRTVLAPGGYHIMLLNLKAPLKVGASFPLKLTFEKAGAVEVTVMIDKPGAMGPDYGAAGAMHDMKGMDMKNMDMDGGQHKH